MGDWIEKVSIVISQGSLDGIYPGLIMANGARAEGIDELSDDHWTVLRFMREEYAEKGTGPTVRVLGKTSGVSVKELYQLFPKGPAKKVAKISGLGKPEGCV